MRKKLALILIALLVFVGGCGLEMQPGAADRIMQYQLQTDMNMMQMRQNQAELELMQMRYR